MLYRIQEKTVIIDGMFYELQDCEGIFASELHLLKQNQADNLYRSIRVCSGFG